MPDPDAPFDDLIPPADPEQPGAQPPRQPFGSPYAIPLSSLVAGTAVAVNDQVIIQPEPNESISASGGGIDGDGD